jgi:catalase (peroxidase I)
MGACRPHVRAGHTPRRTPHDTAPCRARARDARRFPPESQWGANAGLDIARKVLEPVKAKFPWISYADLWTLAGVVAVEAMGGACARACVCVRGR